MAAEVVPLQRLKLAQGPSPFTAEQRYWKSFKNQKSHTSTASWPIISISFPDPSAISPTTAAAAKQNDLFAVTAGPRIDLYSIRKREPLKTIGRFDAVARTGHVRSDGRVLLAGDDSGKMQVFDIAGGSRAVILKTWHTHKQPVWVAKWSPSDLTSLMSASDDKTVRLWDLPSNTPTRLFAGHADYVRSGAFLAGSGATNNMLVTGSYDNTVRVWDARAPGGSVLTFKHAAPVNAVLPLPSGTTIVAAADNVISVLDLVAAKPLRMMTNHQKTVTSLCLASNGRRVVSGGLDGHVKIFETGSWNVVASSKYPSGVLSVSVVTAGASAEDRHLAVGMESGVLSIKTRLTGPQAERDLERQREMAAHDAGTIAKFDAEKGKRKRRGDVKARLNTIGEGVDVVIATETKKKYTKEAKWQRRLRTGFFGDALDLVLDKHGPDHSPLNILTVLVTLRHRSALRDALENRDEASVQPILDWVTIHIADPRYTSACVDVGLLLIDLYAEHAGESTALAASFTALKRRVTREVENAQMACQTSGMVESLIMGSLS